MKSKKAMFPLLALVCGSTLVLNLQHINKKAEYATPPHRLPSAFSGLPPTHRDRVASEILFINMPESTDRLTHITKLVRDIGFDPVPFGTACPECDRQRGKFLTNLRFLQQIAAEAHERFVIVLEDDAELAQQVQREDFATVLHDEMQRVLQPNDGFVFLGVCLDEQLSKTCTPRSCAAFCTHAYMVTPKGARMLLNKYDAYDVENGEISSLTHLLFELVEPPVLGWNFTHDHTATGWRGLFYQARKAPWHAAGPPKKVTIAHEPRSDLLGSFVAPTLYLYAVATYHGWELEILPFADSLGEQQLKDNFALGDKIDKAWGSGFQDASHREDYDPVKLNKDSYETMGFFPAISETSKNKPWISINSVPEPGSELNGICAGKNQPNQHCFLKLPGDTAQIQHHMHTIGGYDRCFPTEFRTHLRTEFLQHNQHRLRHFDRNGGYTVAIHVRRGDILDPSRWIDQFVYAKVARRICKSHPDAQLHVFSAGRNRDGNWNILEGLTKAEYGAKNKCASVSFHLDELEFDTWAHMVAADALITSHSSFSAIPALLSGGEVYFPHSTGHPKLSSFHIFHSETGEDMPVTT